MNINKREKVFSEWVLGRDNAETQGETALLKYVVATPKMQSDFKKLTNDTDINGFGTVLYSFLFSLLLSDNKPSDEIRAYLFRKNFYDYSKFVSVALDNSAKHIDDIIRIVEDINIWSSNKNTSDKNVRCVCVRLNHIGEYYRAKSNAELFINIYSNANGINIEIQYNTNEFTPLFISGIIETAQLFLSLILNDNQLIVSDFISQMNEKTLSIYNVINKPEIEGTKDYRCLYEMVMTYCNAERAAISFNDYTITYRELFKKASQFAKFLTDHKIGKKNVVGLLMERRVDWFFCTLGIVQIGAICLPLDINHPSEWLNDMIADSNADCIVTTKHCRNEICSSREVYILDHIDLDKYECLNGYEKCLPEDDAYIIYTSGSSGKPKGIVLKHRGVINHIHTKIDVLDLKSSDRFTHNFNFCFVSSIWLIFAPLVLGSAIVLYDTKQCRNPIELFTCAAQNGVTILEVVPWLLTVFLKYSKSKEAPVKIGSIRHIILTGEKVNPRLVNDFYKLYNQNLFNAYGQSECSDDTLHYLFDSNKIYDASIIGRPSLNTKIYIFGYCMDLKKPGQVGILYIAGDGLANGYLNLSELTQSAWISNPLFPNGKIFQTNDLVRLTNENTVEYIGRVDNQVKLQGNRIALEDIEFAMIAHHDIDDAAIINWEDEDGNKILCGFYQSLTALSIEELNIFLASKLPKYMMPAIMIKLSEIPRNENGKVDRALLCRYDFITSLKTKNYDNKNINEHIIEIYQDILKNEDINEDDNFFLFGGDSLHIIKLFNILNVEYPQLLNIGDLYLYATANELADYIKKKLDQYKKEDYDV